MPDPQMLDNAPDDPDNSFSTIDLNRTPLAGDPLNIDPPDPSNLNLDGGQVLYHMALGAQPEDFHPALQPMARGYNIAFQPQPTLGQGLLGSLDDIRRAAAQATPDDSGGSSDGEEADDSDVAPSDADGGSDPSVEDAAAKLSDRDRSYLDRYYDAVAKYANQYKVNPAFPLSLGRESGFASAGTYLRTGDAFGMTNNNLDRMTKAASPEEDARKLFGLYGPQMAGVGDDAEAFLNAIQGHDAKGQPVAGWRTYNSRDPDWIPKTRQSIQLIQQDLPFYLQTRPAKPKAN